MKRSFPHYTQLGAMDCGSTCLRMIAKYYGRSYSLQTLWERSFITPLLIAQRWSASRLTTRKVWTEHVEK